MMRSAAVVALVVGIAAWTAEAAFEIDFMRHGETLWNRAKVLQGSVSHSHVLKGVVAALRGGAFDNSILQPNNCINTVRYEDGRFTLVSTGRICYDAAFLDAIRQPRIIAHRGAGHGFMV